VERLDHPVHAGVNLGRRDLGVVRDEDRLDHPHLNRQAALERREFFEDPVGLLDPHRHARTLVELDVASGISRLWPWRPPWRHGPLGVAKAGGRPWRALLRSSGAPPCPRDVAAAHRLEIRTPATGAHMPGAQSP
jgi:hypothetical protein